MPACAATNTDAHINAMRITYLKADSLPSAIPPIPFDNKKVKLTKNRATGAQIKYLIKFCHHSLAKCSVAGKIFNKYAIGDRITNTYNPTILTTNIPAKAKKADRLTNENTNLVIPCNKADIHPPLVNDSTSSGRTKFMTKVKI